MVPWWISMDFEKAKLKNWENEEKHTLELVWYEVYLYMVKDKKFLIEQRDFLM